MSKRVGLFGGTFDPAHSGHVQAVHSFLASDVIDEIWIIVSPYPPHKEDDRERTSFEHRVTMANIAFEGMAKVKVSTVENELPRPSYTYRTIQYLKKKFPGNIFFLCVGEDSVESFHEWYRYKEILKECTLLAVSRPGSKMSKARDEVLEKTVFVDHDPVDVSSTAIRKKETDPEEQVPDRVGEYIKEHKLYS